MAISSRTAKRLSLAALVFSIVVFVVTLLVGRWSGFFAISGVGWMTLSAVVIWFVLSLQFHQRALAEQEKLDRGQLADIEKASAIFEGKDERTALFAVAGRRLQLLEKWFLPLFSVIIAAYQVSIGLYLLTVIPTGTDIGAKEPLLCAVFMTAIAFLGFLISRYAMGMSSQEQWKPLRAGGSFLLAIVVLSFILAVGLALVQFKFFIVVKVITIAIPVLLVILGAETSLNVVLDIYRPRLKGRYARSAFDSRLLGVISEPGKILHTAADAIDYQFGFKVSQTWFYKLLEKAIVPLILFGGVTLYLLSCIVVVSANEAAIIEHFGNPVKGDGEVRIVGPGLSFKWPWPIDIAYTYPTKMVSQLSIGYVPEIDPKTGYAVREPRLWGETHYAEEYNLLVASRQTTEASAVGAVPVSLVVAAVPVQYRIKDLYSFVYNHKDSAKALEAICYRELTRFAASSGIEVDEAADMADSLLGAGRAEAKGVLTQRIQAAADMAGLGVEIVFLGLQGIHPPPEVAADYQSLVGAVQKKQALILNAQAHCNRVLSFLAGSVEDANDLCSLVEQYRLAEENNQAAEVERLGTYLDMAFADAGGDIFSTLREAQSYAFEKATVARATGLRFADQLRAYRAAKDIYRRQQRLAMLEEALEKIRKFVVVADENDTQIFIVDVEEKLTPSLYDLGGFEETKEK
jgi:membrane protease subunit HflK